VAVFAVVVGPDILFIPLWHPKKTGEAALSRSNDRFFTLSGYNAPELAPAFSFPNSIWERQCSGNSIAATLKAAIELRPQVRAQMEFGHERK
jgi:hypothetical protein